MKRQNSIDGVRLPLDNITLQGREKETKQLTDELDRVCCTPDSTGDKHSLVLVSGVSGTGKTSVVAQSLSNRPGVLYASGKFGEKSKANSRAFRNAIGRLLKSMLTHLDLEILRRDLKEKLGATSLSILSIAIDELQDVLGDERPKPKELLREGSSMTFKRSFEQQKWGIRELLRVVCKPERPCVILIDDLQWANIQSIELIKVSDSMSCTLNRLIRVVKLIANAPPSSRCLVIVRGKGQYSRIDVDWDVSQR